MISIVPLLLACFDTPGTVGLSVPGTLPAVATSADALESLESLETLETLETSDPKMTDEERREANEARSIGRDRRTRGKASYSKKTAPSGKRVSGPTSLL